MPELVPMPKLGFDMAEGTLVRKVKKDGETVNKGEVIAEIETDKATVEVESPAAGVVKGWVVEEGQPVPVGAVMAVIGAADEQVDLAAIKGGDAGQAAAPAPAAEPPAPRPKGQNGSSAPEMKAAQTQAQAQPAQQQAQPAAAAPAEAAPSGGNDAPASPIARKMATEAGVDIRQITGTGPGGRITKKDVEQYLASPRPPAAPAAQPAAEVKAAPAVQRPTPAPVVVSTEDQEVPLTKMRQIIARRMTESKQTVPQFYINMEVDMDAAMSLRKQLNALAADDSKKLSVNDFIIKATALALREFPNLNASFAGDKIVRKGHVNIGNAVAIEAGLLTVVVKDADVKPIAQIAAEMKAMVGRVRENKISPADIDGSTFSISNLGMYDAEHFIAIINPPEAAILATGTVKQVPVVKDGAVVPGQRLMITISADHRVTDGAEAARFLQAVKKGLEESLRLLL